jgi:uncharacterized PurR-regulated membrane protein YhhQ (DUF165 family)
MKIPVMLFALLSILAQIVLLASPDYFFLQGAPALLLSSVLSVGLFILVDMVNERWGFRSAAYMVTIGSLLQGMTIVIAVMMGQTLPALTVTLLLLGVWCGDLVDTAVYASMKRRTGAHLIWLRILLSTSCALCIEVLFFVGVVGVPVFSLFAPQLVWKFIALFVSIPLVHILHHRFSRVVL